MLRHNKQPNIFYLMKARMIIGISSDVTLFYSQTCFHDFKNLAPHTSPYLSAKSGTLDYIYSHEISLQYSIISYGQQRESSSSPATKFFNFQGMMDSSNIDDSEASEQYFCAVWENVASIPWKIKVQNHSYVNLMTIIVRDFTVIPLSMVYHNKCSLSNPNMISCTIYC